MGKMAKYSFEWI